MKRQTRGRATNEVAMPNRTDDDPGKGKPNPLIGGHEVHYFLVGSLIGAILLLILLVFLFQR